jgi:hypothetical protein
MEKSEFKVVHFSEEFSMKEIIDYLKDKNDILYYTRTIKENKEFHVIKHNDGAFFKLSILESELLKRYSKIQRLNKFIKDIKIKGNDKFVIIENANASIINIMKNDLNKILLK